MPPAWTDRFGANPTVLALSAARFADALGNSILIIIIPLYVKALPSRLIALPTAALVGIMIALFGIVSGITQPIMGALADRTGRPKLFVQLGLAVMAAGTLAFSVATQFSDLLIIRGLQGLGLAMTVPASMAIMAASTVRQSRGGSMGIFTTFRLLGFSIGPLLGGFLQVHFGFNTAFYTGTAFIVLSIALVQLWVREMPRTAVKARKRFFDPEIVSPALLGLSAATFIMALSFSMMSPLENEFNARLGETAIGFGVAFSALMVTRLFLQTPIGHWSDSVGRKPLLLAGLLLLVPCTALMGFVSSTLQLVGLRLVQGAASAGVAAPAFALAGDLSTPGSEGKQMSVITTGFSVGIAVGPLIAGFLASILFQVPFLIGGAFCLMGAWVVHRFVPETVRP